MELFGETVTFGAAFFLLLALALALSFEFVNGFHDTANAVATVIYTHTLKPVYAVVWSGCWNLIGVIVSSGAVAYGIIALLPHDLVMNVGTGDVAGEYVGFAMIFSLLVSAILWNLGTWYLGLPASSTHTLIGSILGVGVANALMNGHSWTQGLNWEQIDKVILALLVSPIVGFGASALLLLALKLAVHREDLFKSPGKDEVPPGWIRGTLIGTCTGVSFAHGYNDGQKGMGLIMLILIGVLPGAFALQSPTDQAQFGKTTDLAQKASAVFQSQASTAAPAPAAAPAPDAQPSTPAAPASDMASVTKPKLGTPEQQTLNDFVKTGKATPDTYNAFIKECSVVSGEIQGVQKFEDMPKDKREAVRKDIYLLADALAKLNKLKLVKDKGQAKDVGGFSDESGNLYQVHSDRGEDRGCARTRPRDDDRLEAHRRDGWRENRQSAPDLRAGGFGRVGGFHHDPGCRSARLAGQHHARAVIRHRGNHGGESIRSCKRRR